MEYSGEDRKILKPDKWLDFSTNLRPEGQPAWVTKAMHDAFADTRYYSGWALEAARKGLAVYAGVSEDCVLPTAGGLAAIDLALSLRRGKVYTLPATFAEYKCARTSTPERPRSGEKHVHPATRFYSVTRMILPETLCRAKLCLKSLTKRRPRAAN